VPPPAPPRPGPARTQILFCTPVMFFFGCHQYICATLQFTEGNAQVAAGTRAPSRRTGRCGYGVVVVLGSWVAEIKLRGNFGKRTTCCLCPRSLSWLPFLLRHLRHGIWTTQYRLAVLTRFILAFCQHGFLSKNACPGRRIEHTHCSRCGSRWRSHSSDRLQKVIRGFSLCYPLAKC
jgi:hypothetical protein